MKRMRRPIFVVVLLASAAVIALFVVTVSNPETFRGLLSSDETPEPPLPVAAGWESKSLAISAGEIPVAEFVSALSDMTGLPAAYDADTEDLAQRRIKVIAPIDDADVEIVRAILDVNGYRVRVDRLSSGRQVIRVAAER